MEVAVVGVVGVATGTRFRIAVIVYNLRHGHSNTSVRDFPIISTWGVFILGTEVVVVSALVPVGVQQRGHDDFRSNILGRVKEFLPCFFHLLAGDGAGAPGRSYFLAIL